MLLSFELTMPNIGSWSGKWTGSDKKYYVVKNISKRFFDKQEYFKSLAEKGRDSWFYNFGDGWGANVYVEIVDAQEAKKRRKLSKGFCGYEWMVESIIYHGDIKNKTAIKKRS